MHLMQTQQCWHGGKSSGKIKQHEKLFSSWIGPDEWNFEVPALGSRVCRL